MALAPGTRLGAYEIVTPIGSGGMGEVYRARDTKLNRDVAIKIPPRPMFVRLIAAVGFVLVATSLHRWDWLYANPRVWWRFWQGVAGWALCGVASGVMLWRRMTPYSEAGATDPESTTVLELNQR